MKRFLLLMVAAMFLTACGSGDSEDATTVNENQNDSAEESVDVEELSAGDQEACEIYGDVAEFVEDENVTDEVYFTIEDAFFEAENHDLVDLLDELLFYFDEGEGDLTAIKNDLSEWCSL